MKARTEIRTDAGQPVADTSVKHRRRDAALGVLVAVFLSGILWLVAYIVLMR